MLTFTKFFLILVSSFCIIDSSRARYYKKYPLNSLGNAPQNNDFNQFRLSSQWPPTFCTQRFWLTKQAHVLHSCVPARNSTNDWTLHGLWPTDTLGNANVEHCVEREKFSYASISPSIMKNMIQKWPTLAGGSNEGFWNHEISKHGTCAIGKGNIRDVEGYIKKSLELLDRYNPGQMLASRGIIAGQSYTFDKLSQVIFDRLGHYAKIRCIRDKKKQKSYLHEIVTCFDTSFQLANCSEQGFRTNCDKTQEIHYPDTVEEI